MWCRTWGYYHLPFWSRLELDRAVHSHPFCLTVVVRHVMRSVVAGGRRGLQWGIHDRLEDLDFIDNIYLLSQRHLGAYRKIGELRRKAVRLGLKINTAKTKDLLGIYNLPQK